MQPLAFERTFLFLSLHVVDRTLLGNENHPRLLGKTFEQSYSDHLRDYWDNLCLSVTVNGGEKTGVTN